MPERRPSLAHVLRRTAHRARVRGPREVLGLGLERLRENLSSESELIFCARSPGAPPPEREDAFFKEAGTEDAALYAAEIGTESSATFRARLSDSTRCYLVRDPAGQVLHASWVTIAGAWTRELRGYVGPPPGAAYVYESFTVPAARGRGIYPFALASICAHLPLAIGSAIAGKDAAIGSAIAKRIETVWVAVEGDNPASVRAVSKAGFEQAFRLPYRRRLGRLLTGEPEGPRAEEGRELLRGRRI